MITDGRNIKDGTVIQTRVCIIGSGPAGITLAWQLQQAKIDVTLIEGSRVNTSYQKSWPDKYLLYNGVSDGLFSTNEREFLVLPYVNHDSSAWERERFYGGTSTHWGGQSRPEDPIDLEARPGFPGWPASLARNSILTMLKHPSFALLMGTMVRMARISATTTGPRRCLLKSRLSRVSMLRCTSLSDQIIAFFRPENFWELMESGSRSERARST